MGAIHTKILGGQSLAAGEWEVYLSEVHRGSPSMTPRAFGTYRTHGGQSSYEVLAGVLEKKHRDLHVLDVGCGDGYLIRMLLPRLGPKARVTGFDLSKDEIERAKSVLGNDQRVRLLCMRAQEIAIPPSSVDVALCHLTLMLMRPIEPVLAKLADVIKPGGELVAIVTAPRRYGTPALDLANLIAALVDERHPQLRKNFVAGDPRFETEPGIQQLLGASFPHEPWIQDFEILLPTEPEAIWNFHKDMYLIGALPPESKVELKARMSAFVSTLARSSKTLAFPLRLIQVTR